MRISDWSSDVCSSDLVALVAAHEDAAQGSALVKAFLDAQRHAVAQIGKFADLDRRAERARAQFELQPFIGIASDRLDEADDREIERRERNRIGEGNAHQTPATPAHPLDTAKFARHPKHPKS